VGSNVRQEFNLFWLDQLVLLNLMKEKADSFDALSAVRMTLNQMIFAGNYRFHGADIPQGHAPFHCHFDEPLGLIHFRLRWVPFLSHEHSTVATPRRCAIYQRTRNDSDWIGHGGPHIWAFGPSGMSALAKFIDLAAEILNRCWLCWRLLCDVAGEVRPREVVQHFFCFLRLMCREMSNRQMERFRLSLSDSAAIMLNFGEEEPDAVANRVLGCFHG
jgi:hypothetical protein